MTICFFGRYDPNYARNRVFIQGLRQNNVKVIECRSDKKGFLKYFDLIKKHWKIRKQYDVLFVAFPGFQSMILARFLTRKKVIFDSFAPLYESEVLDRKNIKKGSFKAKYYWHLDRLSAKWADVVLLDTNEHIKYFVGDFNLSKEKFRRNFVGSSLDLLSPQEKNITDNEFIVYYHGSITPLQGTRYILSAAKLLEKYKDIGFVLVGSRIKRQFKNKTEKNVSFIENVPFKELINYINKADVCLGIFGDTSKTQRVIPNKVYECVACKKPVITADTLAIRELFTDEDLFLIPIASPEKLAEAILKLKENPTLREKLSENAYNKFIQKATPKILGKELIKIINEI